VAVLAPAPYEITRVAWFLGIPLGIPHDFLTMMQDTPGMLEVGLGCALASIGGGILTHGLVGRWGEVYPSWVFGLAGRRVPPMLAVVPATVVAVVLVPAGFMNLRSPITTDSWDVTAPGILWIVWGAALGAATLAYHLRRQPPCRRCGRGATPPSPGHDQGLYARAVDVYDAVRTRQSIRKFTDQPVPHDVLRRVLLAAANAPSGSNLQPWHVYVVSGEPLTELKGRIAKRLAAGDNGDDREFAVYPPELRPPYLERMAVLFEARYGSLGVRRDDVAARARVRAENWNCFGATTALFCYLDRDMPGPRWSDTGIYLQTVMLLLRAEGLHSCTQEAWAEYHRTVAEVIAPPPERLLFCGMSVGFADPTVVHPRVRHAPLSETVTFLR
jgi:nitroreductase